MTSKDDGGEGAFRTDVNGRTGMTSKHRVSDEGLSILDVERAILQGHIAERQRDAETGEWKYLVAGSSGKGEPITAVVKLGPTGKMILITVFGDED